MKRRADYASASDQRRTSDAQMYVNAPGISLLMQWCRAVGVCHGVSVRSVECGKRSLCSWASAMRASSDLIICISLLVLYVSRFSLLCGLSGSTGVSGITLLSASTYLRIYVYTPLRLSICASSHCISLCLCFLPLVKAEYLRQLCLVASHATGATRYLTHYTHPRLAAETYRHAHQQRSLLTLPFLSPPSHECLKSSLCLAIRSMTLP